ILGFRPEAATVREEVRLFPKSRTSAEDSLTAEVYANDLHGAYAVLHLSLDGENPESVVHARADRFAHYPIGQPVRFDLNPAMVRFFDPKTEKAILTG
ncbi:MAG TPA: TOBE domain-containing protein, partial [Caldilineaceae bacterium]|nr:TOBE domain-containing protein [Caldilineaceae bacterium]